MINESELTGKYNLTVPLISYKILIKLLIIYEETKLGIHSFWLSILDNWEQNKFKNIKSTEYHKSVTIK